MKERLGFLSDLPRGDFLSRSSSDGFIRIVDTPIQTEDMLETPLVDPSIRNMHINIIGKIGMGKSTLICWWALQDIIERRGGVCVIDPKGDLVDTLLRYIPDDRIDDCIVADINDPLPLDFIGCEPDKEDDVVADLKFMLMGSMSDMAQYPNLNKNIENLLYTLIDANQHQELNKEENRHLRCTFLDVQRFLEDTERRDFILAHVTSDDLRKCWKKMPNDADREKITSRINPFLRSKTLSKIFDDPRPRLDLREVIAQKKILLVRVPVVNKSSASYGKFLMAKIQHAMFSVEDEEKRVPFFLYVDEFQNFPTSDEFHRVIDMGRAYQLCLCLSVTRLKPLSDMMRSALGLVSTYVLLQLNPEDAAFYQSQFDEEDRDKSLRDRRDKAHLDWKIAPDGDARDRLLHRYQMLDEMAIGASGPPITVKNALRLPKYQAIFKIGEDFPFQAKTPTPGSKVATQAEKEKIKTIKDQSKKNYGPRPATSATSGQNRSVNSSPLLSPQVRHDKGNGIDYDTIEAETGSGEGTKTKKVDGGETKRP